MDEAPTGDVSVDEVAIPVDDVAVVVDGVAAAVDDVVVEDPVIDVPDDVPRDPVPVDDLSVVEVPIDVILVEDNTTCEAVGLPGALPPAVVPVEVSVVTDELLPDFAVVEAALSDDVGPRLLASDVDVEDSVIHV